MLPHVNDILYFVEYVIRSIMLLQISGPISIKMYKKYTYTRICIINLLTYVHTYMYNKLKHIRHIGRRGSSVCAVLSAF